MVFFFFNDTATTEIYPLSLHDALPISVWPVVAALCAATAPAMGYGMWLIDHAATGRARLAGRAMFFAMAPLAVAALPAWDWESTRLNYNHANISHTVLPLEKNNTIASR